MTNGTQVTVEVAELAHPLDWMAAGTDIRSRIQWEVCRCNLSGVRRGPADQDFQSTLVLNE